MAQTYTDLFSPETLVSFFELPEVQAARAKIDTQRGGSVSFTVPTTADVKGVLQERLGLDLHGRATIPMRWMKGDTLPHIDTGSHAFDNTYLVYLTNSEGQLLVGENSYEMMENTAFVFPEQVRHETVDTGDVPRLLLGPMSETGSAVGGGIFVPGGTIVYIRQEGGNIEYSIDQTTWNPMFFNFNIGNSDTSLGFVKVYFITDITLSSASDYFVPFTDFIQFGNESLNNNGTRPTIFVPVANYDGLIYNGESGTDGKNNITVYNLHMDGTGGSLQIGAGWFGRKYFGKGTTDTYVINCSSSGDIHGGGILGDYAENVTLIGCSSSGNILQALAGGIVGQAVQSVTLRSCWSTGDMAADGVGGIVGANSMSADVMNCYSEGVILGDNAGGIVGSNAGASFMHISNCYSRGNIEGGNAGGICGSLAPGTDTIFTVSITNCYSTGNVNNSGINVNGGICGLLLPYDSGIVNLTITHCYTTGTVVNPTGYILANVAAINGSSGPPSQYSLTNNFSEAGSFGGAAGIWSNTHANTTLTGAPIGESAVGATWVNSGGVGQPYELVAMGYSPYLLPIISSNSLVRTYSQTIAAGSASNAAIKPDLGGNYRLLDITGGDAASRDLITMNGITGAINAPISTVPGTYTIFLRNVGSYNISMFELIVTAGGNGDNFVVVPACCDTLPLIRPSPATNNSSEVITVDKAGKVIVRNVNTYYDAIAKGSVTYLAKPVFATYREYMEYLQGQ